MMLIYDEYNFDQHDSSRNKGCVLLHNIVRKQRMELGKMNLELRHRYS